MLASALITAMQRDLQISVLLLLMMMMIKTRGMMMWAGAIQGTGLRAATRIRQVALGYSLTELGMGQHPLCRCVL